MKKPTPEKLFVSDIPINSAITPYKKNDHSLPFSTSTPHINSNAKQLNTKDNFGFDAFKKSVLDFSRSSVSFPQSDSGIYTEVYLLFAYKH